MSPVIRISEAIFKRLQNHATPLVDTPATVVEKMLDFYEEKHQDSQSNGNGLNRLKGRVIDIDPDNPIDLTHTKVISAKFNGIDVNKWNRLVDIAHSEAIDQLQSFELLSRKSISNISDQKLSKKGFRYLPDAGISIQGESANQTWKSALRLAKVLNVEIEVEFEWRSNKKSAHPGKVGRIRWNPETE